MRCKSAMKLMTDHVDELLPERKIARIRDHLARCATCREAEAGARSALQALDAWPDLPAPEDGLHRLETRLAFAPPPPVIVGGGLRSMVVPFVAGLATAAAILLLVLTYWRGPGVGSPTEDPGRLQSPEAPTAAGGASDLLPGERELQYVDENGLLRRRHVDSATIRWLREVLAKDEFEELFPGRGQPVRASFEER